MFIQLYLYLIAYTYYVHSHASLKRVGYLITDKDIKPPRLLVQHLSFVTDLYD